MITLMVFIGIVGAVLFGFIIMFIQPTELFFIRYSPSEKCYYVAYKEVNISSKPYFKTPLEARTWINSIYKDYIPPKTKFKIIE